MSSAIDDLPPPPQASGGIDDLPPPPAQSKVGDYIRDATKSTIDSLPMIGGVVGGILGTPADAVSGPAGNIVGAGIGGYLGTATKNLINHFYDPSAAPQTNVQAITQPITGGLEQGLMQGSGEAVAPLVTKGIDAAGGVAKRAGVKLLSNTLGANPGAISDYLQNSTRINASPNVAALKDISDEAVGKLADDVEAKKAALDQAQEAYKNTHSDLKDAYRTAGYDARDAVTSAQQTLKDAHNARLQQMSGDVYKTINQLKSDIQVGSGKALDTLNKSNAKVDLLPIYTQIDDTIARLNKAGTDESLAVADKLQAYKERLMNTHGNFVPAPDAKKLIQGLDQSTTYSPMAGAFDQAKNAAFKDVRSALDQSVKAKVAEYAKAMEPVASDTDLLNRVQGFGDRQSGVGLLQRINAPNQLENRAALDQLGQRYGTDFVSGAQAENLPQYSTLQKAQAAQDALRPDLVANKIDQTLANSRQKAVLDQAQADYDAAQEKLAPFKPLAPNAAGQTTAQQKLEQLGKGNNIELTDMFQKLGQLSNTDFVQAMKDQNTLAAFRKGATNGSRNTMLGALVGWAFGGMPGAAIGGEAGHVVDQWGPAITKRVLDGAVKVANNPTVSTISQLSLPEPVKRNMVVGLENYFTNGNRQVTPAQMLPEVAEQKPINRSPAKGPDAWAQQGLSKLGIQDQGLASRLLADPKGKQLLIQASDLKPGSAAMKNLMKQIQKRLGAK